MQYLIHWLNAEVRLQHDEEVVHIVFHNDTLHDFVVVPALLCFTLQ